MVPKRCCRDCGERLLHHKYHVPFDTEMCEAKPVITMRPETFILLMQRTYTIGPHVPVVATAVYGFHMLAEDLKLSKLSLIGNVNFAAPSPSISGLLHSLSLGVRILSLSSSSPTFFKEQSAVLFSALKAATRESYTRY